MASHFWPVDAPSKYSREAIILVEEEIRDMLLRVLHHDYTSPSSESIRGTYMQPKIHYREVVNEIPTGIWM